MPLPMSTTSAATRRATRKFLFLPLLPLTAHLVHLLQHRLRPFLQRLSKLPRLQALLLLLLLVLLLLLLKCGLEEEFHCAGVHCFGWQCPPASVRRGAVRDSHVTDCDCSLRRGILQDSPAASPEVEAALAVVCARVLVSLHLLATVVQVFCQSRRDG